MISVVARRAREAVAAARGVDRVVALALQREAAGERLPTMRAVVVARDGLLKITVAPAGIREGRRGLAVAVAAARMNVVIAPPAPCGRPSPCQCLTLRASHS